MTSRQDPAAVPDPAADPDPAAYSDPAAAEPGPPGTANDDGWSRLDPRSVPAATLTVTVATAGTAVPVAIGLRFSGVSWGWTLFWVLGGIVAATVVMAVSEWIRYRSTSIRIGDERIEYRFRFGFVSRRSLTRDRVRTVEVTADPAQRLLRVATLRVGTGEQSGDDVTFRSIDREVAEELRVSLLRRAGLLAADGRQVGELARFRPGWIRFAPINIWTPALGGIAFGALMQVVGWFNAEAVFLQWFQALFAGMSLVTEILLIAFGGLIVGAVVNLAIFVEGWWNYRLEREPDGSLRIRRGLLVQRSTTFEEKRIRGVSIIEPLGVRLAGAARIDVLATGLRKDSSKAAEPDTVLPAAPRKVARRVAAAILGVEPPVDFTAHPPAARRRRYVRATATVIGVIGVLLVLGWWLTPVISTIGWIALAPVALISLAIARDNYAGLGHTVTDRLLVLRSGSVRRTTEIHYRPSLLGWTLQQSPLQRAAGLATLHATTAAGTGGLRLPDVGVGQAAGLMVSTADEWRQLIDPDGQDLMTPSPPAGLADSGRSVAG